MGMNTNLVAAFDFRAMLTQVKDFCTEYGFYFAIAAAALFLIWIITWIALGVKCRRLKKKNKALGIQNAGYASADEDRANEAARAEAYARAQKEESVSAPAPGARTRSAADRGAGRIRRRDDRFVLCAGE